MTSPTSKVQSPKLVFKPDATIERGVRGADEHSKADVGPWTLDLGLCVTDLRKSFSSPTGETIEVLRGVSFATMPGNTIAITGQSGAGKSTLLHLIGGLETPDHGSVRLDRFDIERAEPAALARFRNAQLGLIFQFHHLLPDLTAAENIAMPLLIARESHSGALHEALQALDQMGLRDRASHPVGHLSGGEQQRVAACRALIRQPSLVLADEPTGNLDASYAVELGKILLAYARRRSAVVIIATHNGIWLGFATAPWFSATASCRNAFRCTESEISRPVHPIYHSETEYFFLPFAA